MNNVYKIKDLSILTVTHKRKLKIHSYYAWVAADNVQKFP